MMNDNLNAFTYSYEPDGEYYTIINPNGVVILTTTFGDIATFVTDFFNAQYEQMKDLVF